MANFSKKGSFLSREHAKTCSKHEEISEKVSRKHAKNRVILVHFRGGSSHVCGKKFWDFPVFNGFWGIFGEKVRMFAGDVLFGRVKFGSFLGVFLRFLGKFRVFFACLAHFSPILDYFRRISHMPHSGRTIFEGFCANSEVFGFLVLATLSNAGDLLIGC